MKLLDFTNKNLGWPYSANTFQFMQEQLLQLQALSMLAGNLYVVSGCQNVGGVVQNGWVVINGEVLPFIGASVQANVVIVPTITTASFGDPAITSTPVIANYSIDKYATFGTAAIQYAWANFENKDIGKGVMQRMREAETDILATRSDLNSLTTAFNLYQPDWADITNKPTALITYAAVYVLPQEGNIGGGLGNPSWPNAISDNDSAYTIPIPPQTNSNYVVVGSLEGYSSDLNLDNDVAWITGNYAPDSFKLVIREISASVQKLKFRFAIIKI